MTMTEKDLERVEWTFKKHFGDDRVDDDAMTIRWGENVIPRLLAEVRRLREVNSSFSDPDLELIKKIIETEGKNGKEKDH